MKKTNFKKFLLLFCIVASVFCMTACTDTISSSNAKESMKKQEVVDNQRNLAIWATDIHQMTRLKLMLRMQLH